MIYAGAVAWTHGLVSATRKKYRLLVDAKTAAGTFRFLTESRVVGNMTFILILKRKETYH